MNSSNIIHLNNILQRTCYVWITFTTRNISMCEVNVYRITCTLHNIKIYIYKIDSNIKNKCRKHAEERLYFEEKSKDDRHFRTIFLKRLKWISCGTLSRISLILYLSDGKIKITCLIIVIKWVHSATISQGMEYVFSYKE